MLKKLGIVFLSIWAVIICSCGDDDRMKTYPVEGQVLIINPRTKKYEPLEGAMVSFHPNDRAKFAKEAPSGTTDKQGNFKLSTYLADDGAPISDYKVTIVKYPTNGDDPDGDQATRNLLPEIYGRPESTPFKVTVKEGDNKFDAFKLSKGVRRRPRQ